MRWLVVLLSLSVLACAEAPAPSIYRETDRTTPHVLTERPSFPGYGAAIASQPVPWSRRSLSQDFRRLMFYTEWGGRVPRLLRWEKPARIALADAELDAYRPFVRQLTGLIRENAPRTPVELSDARRAEITVRVAPRAAMERIAADALCFFVPIDADWSEYLAAFARGEVNWTTIDAFKAVTIFIPRYAPPHEVRSCILEEVTQALGPGNDLSALEDSIYNDDNAHVWPTSFDLLMLRLLYEPEIASGLGEAEAEDRAYRALQRLQDDFGQRRRTPDFRQRAYDAAMAGAVSAPTLGERRQFAARAIAIAEAMGGGGHLLGEALKTAASSRSRRMTKRPCSVTS